MLHALEIGLDAAFQARGGRPAEEALKPAFTGRRGAVHRQSVPEDPRRQPVTEGAVRRASPDLPPGRGPSACCDASRTTHRTRTREHSAASRVLPPPHHSTERRSVCPPGSGTRGLFSPCQLPAWLVEKVENIVYGFAGWFTGHYASGLVFLPDHGLATGEVSPADTPRARDLLAALHRADPPLAESLQVAP